MAETSLYKKILKELLKLIEENKHVVGYKLPSERQLSTKFKSSRPPIRKAYQLLLEQGKIEVIHGKGYFIKQTSDTPIIPTSISPHVLFIAPTMKTNFMQQIQSGMTKFCENNDIELSFKATNDSSKKEEKLLESVLYSNYDGLILFPVDNEYYNEPLLKLSIKKFPTVIIDRYVKNINLSFVSTDNHNALEETVKYLKEKEYKNIVYFSIKPSVATTNEERISGYNSGLLKYYGAIVSSNLVLLKSDDRDYICNTIKSYLEKHPKTDAIIINGVFLSAAHLAVSELKIDVPNKLRIVIIDNECTFAEKKLIKPIIIEQAGEKIGYFAVNAIYDQIIGNKSVVSKKFPTKIIDSDF